MNFFATSGKPSEGNTLKYKTTITMGIENEDCYDQHKCLEAQTKWGAFPFFSNFRTTHTLHTHMAQFGLIPPNLLIFTIWQILCVSRGRGKLVYRKILHSS